VLVGGLVLVLAGCTGDDPSPPSPSTPPGTLGVEALPGDGWDADPAARAALLNLCSAEVQALDVAVTSEVEGGRVSYGRDGVVVVSGAWNLGDSGARAALADLGAGAELCRDNPRTTFAVSSSAQDLRVVQETEQEGETGRIERIYTVTGPVLVLVSSGSVDGAAAPPLEDLVPAAVQAAGHLADVDS